MYFPDRRILVHFETSYFVLFGSHFSTFWIALWYFFNAGHSFLILGSKFSGSQIALFYYPKLSVYSLLQLAGIQNLAQLFGSHFNTFWIALWYFFNAGHNFLILGSKFSGSQIALFYYPKLSVYSLLQLAGIQNLAQLFGSHFNTFWIALWYFFNAGHNFLILGSKFSGSQIALFYYPKLSVHSLLQLAGIQNLAQLLKFIF